MEKTDLHCPNCGSKTVEKDSWCNGAWHYKHVCKTCGSEFFMPYIKRIKMKRRK